MDVLHLLLAGGGTAALAGVAYQLRVHLRDRGDRTFAKYVFDQTRNVDASVEILSVRRARGQPRRRKKDQPKHVRGEGEP
jgi:hypothetical protein